MKYGTIERVIYDSRHFYDLNMICYTTYKRSWMEKLRLFFKRSHYIIIEGYYIRYKYLNHKDGLAAYILDYHFINNREIKNETLEYIDLR